MATVKTDGFKALEANLRRLGSVPAKKIGNKALKKAGQVIADYAKVLVPVDTGKLEDSIMVVQERPQGQGEVRGSIGFRRGKPSMARRGMLVEFGTSKSPTQPFIRPAIDARGEAAISLLGGELWKGIEAEAKRLR
jgi:HK97 gp10 family phage protein